MIPTIETIVEDLAAGTISKQQAIVWLHIHAEDAGMDLRDSFAMAALAHSSTNCDDAANDVKKSAAWAYELADAMIAARSA